MNYHEKSKHKLINTELQRISSNKKKPNEWDINFFYFKVRFSYLLFYSVKVVGFTFFTLDFWTYVVDWNFYFIFYNFPFPTLLIYNIRYFIHMIYIAPAKKHERLFIENNFKNIQYISILLFFFFYTECVIFGELD